MVNRAIHLGWPATGFTPTSTESSNFLARATTITSNTDKTRYDALISGLVSDGDFSTLDALYIFAAPDRTAAVLNLVQTNYPATENGTVNFTAYVGYTGNGSNFYLDTGLNPKSSLPAPIYALNSASFGYYCRTNNSPGAGVGTCMGAADNGDSIVKQFGGDLYWRINTNTDRNITSSTIGQFIATRTASNLMSLYRNGNTTPLDSGSTVSNALPDDPFAIVAGSSAGTVGAFDINQFSAALMGGGLSSAAMARIAARINTFMTAYGINVY